LHANGTRIVKIFLHLSKEEQRTRFLARIDDPDKNWKFSPDDIKERGFWDEYMKAYESLPRRDQHRALAVVRGAGGRQEQRAADRVADIARHARRAGPELSQGDAGTGEGIAGDPGSVGALKMSTM